MKVAIIHYWLVGMRGGEKVLEAQCELFPDAHIYTHVFDKASVSPAIASRIVGATFINRLPRARRWYKAYLPLMPLALEQLDLSGYDLIISNESGPAKSVIPTDQNFHICYCHTPMRYLWSMHASYLRGMNPLARPMARLVGHYLRLWDYASAARVDAFVANSTTVARRIRRTYRREATVVHPPTRLERFTPLQDASKVEDFYLVVSQLVGYKRVDLAVEACTRTNRRLIVIGTGEEEARLKKMAGPSVTFLGWRSDDEVRDHYARCRALLFPGEEDFGLTPVEAMASGRPVIAYGRGGALDTVKPGVSGLFFDQQTPESLVQALERFEGGELNVDPDAIVQHASQFGMEQFKRGFMDVIETQRSAC